MCFSPKPSWLFFPRSDSAQSMEEALCPLLHGGGSVPPPACGAAQPWAIAKRVAAPAGILENILDNGDGEKNK